MLHVNNELICLGGLKKNTYTGSKLKVSSFIST